MLQLETRQAAAETLIVELKGRLTLGTRLIEVESLLGGQSLDTFKRMIIDLSGIDYADSAGLGMLLQIFGKVRSAGVSFTLAGANERVTSLLLLTNVNRIIDIQPDLETALANVPASGTT